MAEVPDQSESSYTGPERRRDALTQLGEVKTSVDELAREVRGLTDQLTKVNEIERKQGELEGGVHEQDVRNQQWRRKATWRTVAAIGVLSLLVAGLATLAIIVAVSGSSTASQFKSYRSQSQTNCNIRNQQVQSNADFFDGLLAILSTTTKSPQITALDNLVNKQIKEEPKQVNCALTK